jgi:hypothetical protein
MSRQKKLVILVLILLCVLAGVTAFSYVSDGGSKAKHGNAPVSTVKPMAGGTPVSMTGTMPGGNSVLVSAADQPQPFVEGKKGNGSNGTGGAVNGVPKLPNMGGFSARGNSFSTPPVPNVGGMGAVKPEVPQVPGGMNSSGRSEAVVEISGILLGNDTDGNMAILNNGKIIKVGSSLLDQTVVSIQSDGVVLESGKTLYYSNKVERDGGSGSRATSGGPSLVLSPGMPGYRQ